MRVSFFYFLLSLASALPIFDLIPPDLSGTLAPLDVFSTAPVNLSGTLAPLDVFSTAPVNPLLADIGRLDAANPPLLGLPSDAANSPLFALPSDDPYQRAFDLYVEEHGHTPPDLRSIFFDER